MKKLEVKHDAYKLGVKRMVGLPFSSVFFFFFLFFYFLFTLIKCCSTGFRVVSHPWMNGWINARYARHVYDCNNVERL